MKQPTRHATDIFEPDSITIPDRLRSSLNESSVVSLVESIQRIGLQTPITIRWGKDEAGDDDAILVAGAHRLEACKRLHMEFIGCIVFEGTETEARLWEIAENLHRAELTLMERSDHIAEWVRLTEEKRSLAQVAPVKSRREDGRGGSVGSGINAAVRELGIDRTEAQRSVKIASITPEAKAAAKAAGIDDKQSAMLRVRAAGENVADQVAAVAREKTRKKPETKEQWLKSGMKWWKRASTTAWQREFLSNVKELEPE